MNAELMTLNEKLGLGGQTTVLGLVVVFVALVLIIVIVSILSSILKEKKKEKSEPLPDSSTAPVDVSQNAPVAAANDSELIAVLTAAVMVMQGSGSPNGLVVRSYRRVGESAWAKAGRNSQIYNKF